MVKQKAVSKGKKDDTTTTKPKTKKRKRTPAQINQVEEKGNRLAVVVGAIIALSSIRWTVTSKTVKDLAYVVTLSSRGLICQCAANADGKMICKHSFGVGRLPEIEWWKNRIRKKQRSNVSAYGADTPNVNLKRSCTMESASARKRGWCRDICVDHAIKRFQVLPDLLAGIMTRP